MSISKIAYFDAHSHLHSDFFKKKANSEEVIEQMKQKNIFSVVVGVDAKDSTRALKMAQKHHNLFCSVGQHPLDNPTEVFEEETYQKLIDQGGKKIVCIGECGLDYFWPSKNVKEGKLTQEDFEQEKARQKNLFEKQIDLAVANDLPLMLHVRSFENGDAHKDAFAILDKKKSEFESRGDTGTIRANFHFFTESAEIAREVVKRGFMISLPGVITFADLDESIRVTPIGQLMSETDSPFAAPKPHRGKVNTPLFIPEVVEKVAQVKGMSKEVCNKHLIKNTVSFFNLEV